jgi:hypothetical protein
MRAPRDIDDVSGRLLVNLYLDAVYCFTCVGFPPNIFHPAQSLEDGFVKGFGVDDAVLSIVAIF